MDHFQEVVALGATVDDLVELVLARAAVDATKSGSVGKHGPNLALSAAVFQYPEFFAVPKSGAKPHAVAQTPSLDKKKLGRESSRAFLMETGLMRRYEHIVKVGTRAACAKGHGSGTNDGAGIDR
jgi:hypothetical protein